MDHPVGRRVYFRLEPGFLSSQITSVARPPPSGAKEKTEMNVLTGPHDVVGSPGIVEEVAMNAGGKIRLALRKGQGRLCT